MAVTWKKIAYSDQKLDDFGAPDDNTDLNVSTSAHGLAPKLPNDATKYLDGTGAWSVPAGGGGGATLVVSETEVFNDSAPDSWTDLDLSGTVGAQETLVVIKMITSYSAPMRTAFRKNGDTDEHLPTSDAYMHGASSVAPEDSKADVVIVPTDSNGVIEWCSEGTGTTTLDVIAYIY